MLTRVEHENVLLPLGQVDAHFITEGKILGDKCLQSCHFEGQHLWSENILLHKNHRLSSRRKAFRALIDDIHRVTIFNGGKNEKKMDFFSSPEPKAQGELIVWDSSRCPSLRPSTLSNMNISETSWPIIIKFHQEHHWGGGLTALGFG